MVWIVKRAGLIVKRIESGKLQDIGRNAKNAKVIAQFAHLPPKWQAELREQSAELTFFVRREARLLPPVQRIARVYPPLHFCHLCMVDVREVAAVS